LNVLVGRACGCGLSDSFCVIRIGAELQEHGPSAGWRFCDQVRPEKDHRYEAKVSDARIHRGFVISVYVYLFIKHFTKIRRVEQLTSCPETRAEDCGHGRSFLGAEEEVKQK
jgi:hypothetical protein